MFWVVVFVALTSVNVFCDKEAEKTSCGCATNRPKTSSSSSSSPSCNDNNYNNNKYLKKENDDDVTIEDEEEDKKGEYNGENEVKAFLSTNQMSFIAGGTFLMGTNKPIFKADGEGPERKVEISSFYMDVHEVSNADFEVFVKSTGYVTEVKIKFNKSFSFIVTYICIQHVNPSRLILCLEVKESHSLCVIIYIFFVCGCFCTQSYSFLCVSNANNLHTIVWFQVFLSNINNYLISSYYFSLIIVICLHTVIWFQVTNYCNL